MYQTGKLYEVEKKSAVRLGNGVSIRLIGGSISITIYGSETEPTGLGDMADISGGEAPFTSAGWLAFETLPRFVAFNGTATDIEVTDVSLTEKRNIT